VVPGRGLGEAREQRSKAGTWRRVPAREETVSVRSPRLYATLTVCQAPSVMEKPAGEEEVSRLEGDRVEAGSPAPRGLR